MGRFCGSLIPTALNSSGNAFLIKFKSDGSVSKKGFEISYQATHGNSSYFLLFFIFNYYFYCVSKVSLEYTKVTVFYQIHSSCYRNEPTSNIQESNLLRSEWPSGLNSSRQVT